MTSTPTVSSSRLRAWLPFVWIAAVVWMYGYRLATPVLLDNPNDAQYAEVAREMVETGEWVSPQLDYVLFLNKPPLSYWLVALSFTIFGVNEFAARLPGALAAVVLFALIWRLGQALWRESVGWRAAGVALATAGLILDARHVRPDLLLTAAVAGALLACTHLAHTNNDREQRRARLGLQIALAGGLLAKGMVGLLFPAAAVFFAVLVSRNMTWLRLLATPRAWWLFLLLVVPWHVAAALRHDGFAWDYVVNQHLLFFLDRKLPRDSAGIPLWQFWAAFAGRLFPWTLFLPVAVVRVWRLRDARDRWAAGLVVGWAATVLGLFSVSGSRLEHYTLPALPACALLIGAWFDRAAQERCAVLTLHFVPLLLLGVIAPFALPRLIAGQDWLAGARELPDIARSAGWVFAIGWLATLCLVTRPRLALVPPIVMMAALLPIAHRGFSMMAPVNSSAPLAAVINRLAEPGDVLVYEAPMEYQQVAGLLFYTGRKWAILEPIGWVSPPYLVPHAGELFISRADLERMWKDEHVFLVSDPLAAHRSMQGIVPEPFWTVARSDARWLVSNEHP